ncbi:hypothetical protein J2810_004631 [Chryseobacterium rhizosphaerae]|uniref:hypothetical protein n=1 Tax=Chryseobacterium rhizosphaerae TaxID=395937 RepID=UPI00285F928C|nr:hypothetical protein [Chryseobacterium rhizosphaerae]MDR6548541.1 hypothetical protein [Chryseobacterium rhizosphaerae]
MNSLLHFKTKLINDLSEFPSVVFVGGTSEYLQGFRSELNDIDISTKSPELLWKFGYVFRGQNKSLYGLSGQRAFIKNQGILIDIFVDDNVPDFINVGKFKCQTVESMLKLSEDTKIYNKDLLSPPNYERLLKRIERLKSYKKPL